MLEKTTIFWFRQDLRILDNPGLWEASKNGPIMPIYILDDACAGSCKRGEASRWWLYHSLKNLNRSLQDSLNIYEGDSLKIILQILKDHPPIKAVYWNRCYEPWRVQDDAAIKSFLKNKGIECKSFNGSLLWEPWQILTKDHKPYKVYTPFYRKGCLEASTPRTPLPKHEKLIGVKDPFHTKTLEELPLLPTKTWYRGLEKVWKIGEQGAQEAFQIFLEQGLQDYQEGRDYPFRSKVSRLSPHLHFGEISPHQIWYCLHSNLKPTPDKDCFLKELAWREFSYYCLYHFPTLPFQNFQSKFDTFPWQDNPLLLHAWQKGQTGYPIVDAGMRELWHTGYMHNRIRMIVASFLVKNLGISWHHGRDWFWDCLVDADLANNSFGWQWAAGSGADAAPYFRIFNPITQGEKFDPEGHYTRTFVPELSRIPIEYLFKPWQAPEQILKQSGIILGQTYPYPIVDLASSRSWALQTYASLK